MWVLRLARLGLTSLRMTVNFGFGDRACRFPQKRTRIGGTRAQSAMTVRQRIPVKAFGPFGNMGSFDCVRLRLTSLRMILVAYAVGGMRILCRVTVPARSAACCADAGALRQSRARRPRHLKIIRGRRRWRRVLALCRGAVARWIRKGGREWLGDPGRG